MSTVAGRKTYTEEELQNALEAILSGKLGTRRAAVLYGIPRSTLRNKVYKLAMEQKREANLLNQASVLDALDDDDDKELSGGEDEKSKDDLMPEEILRLSSSRASASAASLPKYGQLFENNSPKSDGNQSTQQQQQQMQSNKSSTSTSSSPPIGNNPWLNPDIFPNLLLAGGLMQQKYDDPTFQELLRNLLIRQQELIKEQLKNSVNQTPAKANVDHLNNGKPSDTRNIMHNLSMLQQQQQQQQNRLIKSETPDTVQQALDLNNSDEAAVILKIPSYKLLAGSSSSSGKNGDNANDSTPQTTPPLHSRSPQTHLSADISPPINRQNNDSQSPPITGIGSKGMLSLRDVIAKSITRTFSQQNANETLNKPSMDHLEYKRPSISVIRHLGGTDISRFATNPNMIGGMHSHSNNSGSPSNLNNSGKGTRPKRGKYRNYDRDSLVEAVKAVQRGEMSVHRAGSYYGVPHSTLEYKVKERHLMRPRKREPKTQPLDSSGGSTSSISSVKMHDVGGSSNMRNLDKSSKSSMPTAKTPLKTPPFPASSENGMKMGLFDPSQLQYPPQLFWPHAPGFTGLPIDFAQRTSGAASAAAFTGNAESYFATQMMRFQEDALRSNANNSNKSETSTADLANLNKKSKTDRELTLESLYDGGANGSFLDGIIRHSLDRKTDSIPHGALLDQLVKNNRHSMGDADNSINPNNKRAASPLGYVHHQRIKRERTGSSSGDTDRESVERDISKESVESLLKYRDNLSLRVDDKVLKGSSEDLNGISPDNKAARSIDADDSS